MSAARLSAYEPFEHGVVIDCINGTARVSRYVKLTATAWGLQPALNWRSLEGKCIQHIERMGYSVLTNAVYNAPPSIAVLAQWGSDADADV